MIGRCTASKTARRVLAFVRSSTARLPLHTALPLTHRSTLPPTQAIILEQAAQRELKLTMAAAEKDMNTSYDVYAESVRKMGQYTDAEVQAGRAEMRTRVMEENLQLAASQSASKSFLTTQVYKNSVDPSFFDQFGKTSR